MTDHNAITNWPNASHRYFTRFRIGSETDGGGHLRGSKGWPYSVYKAAAQIGVTDAVVCHGIQHRADAVKIRDLLNAAA